ncbi:GNAT family N-acetyltransferase [Salinibius halmophilus]|uniref:GNAT family N-acetyltransferase n=1 Tax=Salinibius halmophilus TaxID=1853216 RepID=UPI000E67436C|nr:GNAT family N-acetyltransferase [Salinibius halmophilus]
MPQVRLLTDEHFSQVLTVLVSAYREDPIFKTLLHAEKPEFQRRLRATIRELLVRHLAEGDPIFGIQDEQGEITACGCITAQSLKSEVSGSWLWRLKMLTTAGIGATTEFLQYIDQIDAYIPSYPHRLLTLFAVEKGHQHQGLGVQLMDSIVQFCIEDEASSHLYLVSDMQNQTFFDQFEPIKVKSIAQLDNVEAQLIKLKTEAY